MNLKILKIGVDNDTFYDVVELIKKYRIFYKCSSASNDSVFKYTKHMIKNNKSRIWAAYYGDRVVGFTQVYKTYTTIGLGEIWILNDLYVEVEYRGGKIGQKLAEKVISEARKNGAVRVDLKTSFDNELAKKLYLKLGFCKDMVFEYYSKNLV